MSPSEAPESEDPNFSMASLSSAILQRLDRQRHAARALVDVGDLGVDAVAHGEALGALVGAVAAEVRLADEGRHRRVVLAEAHFDAARGHFRDLDRTVWPLRKCRRSSGRPRAA
jgi:hypothetical protein